MSGAFDRIIGYDSVKQELELLADTWKNPDKYRRLGGKPPHALLLSGNPGIGKTLFSSCLIEACGLPFFTVRKTKQDDAFLAELKEVFEKAKASAPAIVFFDDLDKFSPDGEDSHRDAAEFVAVQTGMDETDGCGVYVVATANHPYKLPDSLMRSGRFDVKIELQLPSPRDAEKIFYHYLTGTGFVADGTDLSDFAGILSENSCSDIAAIVNLAALYAGYENRDKIDRFDLLRAVLRFIYGAPESEPAYTPSGRAMIAYHEAGHAVVAEVQEPGCVRLVSVEARSFSNKGDTCVEKDEEYFCRMSLQEDRVRMILGGKAATELVYGETDAGFRLDLFRAKRLMRRFRDEFSAYGFASAVDHESPDGIRTDAERVIAEKLEEYYKEAKQIIARHRRFLDAIVDELTVKGTLLGSDIRRIREEVGD